jgi:CCR4-NOT transcription complex subunit 4
MQKKQRKQTRTENLEQELEAAATKIEPEAEIAPIMGRKKKQKKERTVSSAAGGSTPAASRPPSPGPRADSIIHEESPAEVAKQQDSASEKQDPEKGLDSPAKQTPDIKSKGKAKPQPPPSPEPVSAVTEIQEEPAEKTIPTPASILQDLVSAGIIDDITNLNFLKLPTLSGRHQEAQSDLLKAIPKLTITPEDQAALLAGKLVRKNVDGPNRIMLTPNGDCIRNLTQEEEDQFLALQASIAEENGPAAFFSTKHHTANGFALVGGRAVPNGPPAFFPQSEGKVDPVAKIQRDEALSYINQYVLPSLHTNSQLEKALNANALDAEILRSNDSAAWASWANDPATPPPENGPPGFTATHEGILATGLQNITAHFGIGRDIDRGQPLGNVSMLSLADAESAMQMARKETEGLEKRLNALLKKNKRLLLGSGH